MKPCCELSRKSKIEPVEASIVAPQDFHAAGLYCDIKRLGTGKGRKRNLAPVVSEALAAVIGMFTTNRVCSAPVKVCVNV
jgi:glutamate N-acetyltransferase/amino-acid N-acetyltransferase